MHRLLPENERVRSAVVLVAATLFTLLCSFVLFDGGLPVGIVFDGVVTGAVASLTTVGIVLVYRSIRIINFAQTAFGVFGSTAFFLFVRLTELPFLLTLVISILISAAVGLAAGIVSIRFLKASRLVLTVVTAVTALFLVQFAPNIARLSFFKGINALPQQERTGGLPITEYLPFSGFEFQVGDYPVPFGFSHVFALEMVAVVLLVLAGVLRYTKVGVAVRALSENPERASLLGIAVPALVVGVFVVSGILGGLTTVGTAMLTTPGAANNLSPAVLIVSLAAAVLAKMERLPTAVVATILLSVLARGFRFAYPEDSPLIAVFYLLVLSVGLLAQSKRMDRVEQAQVSWAATDEPRRVPAVLAGLPVVRGVRYGIYGVALLIVGIVPFVASIGFVNLASTIALTTIVVISLVVLTGWGGQVSLGQMGFTAVGAVVAAALTTTVGITFWIAVPVATAVSAAVAVLVGIPALRIKGLFLLPVTLAFAFTVENVFFDERYFGWLLPTAAIERPTLFFLDFTDETSMYFLSVASLVAAIVAVGNLRRTRAGRILIALRENETNVQSFGVDVFRTKLLAFAISGALAGFAGAVFVHQQQGITASSYGVIQSLQVFNTAIIGGVGSVAGALLGTLYFESLTYFLTAGLFQVFLNNGGTIIIILAFPGGLVSLVQAARDSVLRIIAQRNQLVVPSLFADYDADALERREVPLDDLSSDSGLAALPPDQRWAMRSELYRGRGLSAAERFGQASRSVSEQAAPEPEKNPLLGTKPAGVGA